MEILYYAIAVWVGILIGVVLRGWLKTRTEEASGTIYVRRDRVREKVVYELELEDYPEKLEFKKVVIFKVDSRDLNTASNEDTI